MKGIYFLMGFIVALPLFHSANALTQSNISEIVNFQSHSREQTGEYLQYCEDDYCVFTYEKLCKGFHIVQYEENKIVSDGYGDLEDEYTWEKMKLIIHNELATTTNEAISTTTSTST